MVLHTSVGVCTYIYIYIHIYIRLIKGALRISELSQSHNPFPKLLNLTGWFSLSGFGLFSGMHVGVSEN